MAKANVEKVTVAELKEVVKANLVGLYGEGEKVTNKDVDFALKAVTQAVVYFLEDGKNVGLNGIGTLELRERSARVGRNPQTGEEIEISARKSVALNPSKTLKEAVKGL